MRTYQHNRICRISISLRRIWLAISIEPIIFMMMASMKERSLPMSRRRGSSMTIMIPLPQGRCLRTTSANIISNREVAHRITRASRGRNRSRYWITKKTGNSILRMHIWNKNIKMNKIKNITIICNLKWVPSNTSISTIEAKWSATSCEESCRLTKSRAAMKNYLLGSSISSSQIMQ